MFAPPLPEPRIELHYKPARPSLSDSIELEVKLIGAPPDVVLRPPEIPPVCVTIDSVQEAGGSRIIRLDPIQPGPCRIPPFHTRCIGDRQTGCDIVSAAVEIPIGTIVKPPPDIKDQDEEPLPIVPPKPPSVWWWALLPLFLALIAVLFIRMFSRNPTWRARRRLKRARTFDDLQASLRDYLGARLRFNARACSSPELAEALRPVCVLPGLVPLLATFDRARFSGEPEEGFEKARAECRALIKLLEKQQNKRPRARI
jgi:hypothetical protein